MIMADTEHFKKDFMKERVCEFLTRINEVGISEVKAEYSAYAFRNYVKLIRSMKINPLCFSSVINGKQIDIGKIDNFSLLENAVNIDI